MAASFADFNTIAADAIFRGRVMYALEVAAVNIMAEAGGTPNHTLRIQFAKLVLGGSADPRTTALAVLSLSNIAAEANVASPANGGYAIPDVDIQNGINSLFNSLAGIPAF